jgi:hypothetical protein
MEMKATVRRNDCATRQMQRTSAIPWLSFESWGGSVTKIGLLQLQERWRVWYRWLTPVILATQEAEIRRISI